jgi:hypothetical protein
VIWTLTGSIDMHECKTLYGIMKLYNLLLCYMGAGYINIINYVTLCHKIKINHITVNHDYKLDFQIGMVGLTVHCSRVN